MNPDTGAIARFETLADAELAGYSVPLTEKQVARLPITRDERKAWLKTYLKAHKARKALRKKRKAERSRRKAGRK